MKLTKVFSFVVGSFGVAQAADLSDPKVRSFITDLLGLQTKAGFFNTTVAIYSIPYTVYDTPVV